MKYKEMTRIFSEQVDNTYKCEHCGHSVMIGAKHYRKICNWCKHWVYKNAGDEFKDKLMSSIKRI